MDTEKTVQLVVEWLKSYCDNTGMKGFVVGVSGGIDSAVTSTLCAETGKQTLLLNMPILQDPVQESLAERHIQDLKRRYAQVQGITTDLTGPFQVLEKTFPAEIRDQLTMANSRARLRMLTLYAFASANKLLVTGTGNRIEDFGIGFFTKYGDGGVDISPIADLMKTEVYAIGKELGVSKEILKAPPADGLWADNRSDEDQIGASYAELEWAMRFEESKRENKLDNKTLNPDQLSERQKEVLKIYRNLHEANKHKVEPIPVFKVPENLR